MSSPAQESAAAWLAKQDRGFTPAEAAEFARWAAQPAHAAALEELESAWNALDQLSALRPSGSTSRTPDPDLLRPAEKRAKIYRWRPLLVSAAAAAAAGVALFFWNGSRRSTPELPATAAFETAVGGERTVELADGSHLQLNTNSAVDIRFNASIREVHLRRGEIFCTVTHDSARPFVVKSRGISVRAVGTAFDVLEGAQRIEVLVTEGKVRLSAEGENHSTEPTLLTASHRATAPVGRPESEFVIVPIAAEEAARSLAWREHQLEFKDSSLAEVAQEFNRYNTQQLVIADAETATVAIGGRFSPNNIDGFIRLLESSFGIVAERRNAQTLVLHKSQ